MRSSVDLPQPEAPIRQTNSPRSTTRLAPRSASMPRRPFARMSCRRAAHPQDQPSQPCEGLQAQQALARASAPPVGEEAGHADHAHAGHHDLGARELPRVHDHRAEPVCTPVISPTTITTQAKPRPSRRPVKIARQRGRQHHAEELRRARAAEHRRRLEQARIDAAHGEDGVDQDRIEGAERDQEEGRAGPRPNRIIDSGSHAVTGIGRRNWKIGSSSCAHEFKPPDQHAQRQRHQGRQQESAIDPAHRCQQMDEQHAADTHRR